MRSVNGTLTSEVIGWVAKPVHIGFVMPMTILNLASLIIILKSILRAKESCYEFDPTDPRPLLLADPRLDESEPSGWADGVSYRSREVRECHIIMVLITETKWSALFQCLMEEDAE
jgi:hypothetical protein